ncbi:head GIN domain-containing protein [soil metagenome]
MRASCALAAAALLLSGCGLITVEGSGVEASDERNVEAFREIEVDGSADVTVTVGGPPSVTVTTDDNLLERVTTEVGGDRLRVDIDGNLATSLGIRVDVVTPELDTVVLGGSGSIEAGELTAEELDVQLDGSGRITATGTVVDLEVSLSGSGRVALFDLRAQDADVHLDGSGDVQVTATGELDADLNGSGTITYDGSPEQISTDVDGSGEVTPR